MLCRSEGKGQCFHRKSEERPIPTRHFHVLGSEIFSAQTAYRIFTRAVIGRIDCHRRLDSLRQSFDTLAGVFSGVGSLLEAAYVISKSLDSFHFDLGLPYAF